jgi:protein-disulfide isomerase
MKNIPLLLGTIIGTLVLIVVVATMFSGGSSTTDQIDQNADQSVLMEGARHILIPGSSVKSNEEATDEPETTNQRITIVEFSDFQCPACKASQPAVENVKLKYPDQIQLVYRHFPLDSIHPNARLAAIASEAVASLDETKFWPFHDVLFEQQQVWSEISDRQELKDTFTSYATQLGLDSQEFLEKMDDNSVAELVNTDVALGTRLGVNSTPTFYVNGIKTSAPQLQATVEQLLSN